MPCRPAISSLSLGLPSVHALPPRLDQAAHRGLDIELFHDEILENAKQFSEDGQESEHDNQVKAAHAIRAMCDERDLRIVCLQPFRHYEGLIDREEHQRRIEEMQLWINLVKILGTNLIGIPSSFLGEDRASGDMDLIISDLREVADLGASHDIRFSYEALCWGTHIDTWEKSWEVVRGVDRPNFGICIDTFNLAGRVFADPAADNGLAPKAEAAMKLSMQRLREMLDVGKLFWVQVVDAKKLDKPLREEHPYYVDGQPSRMSWSRNCRLFYGEEDLGGYLPVKEVLDVLVNHFQFRGCVSAELFNKSLADTRAEVPEEHATRVSQSFNKLAKDYGLI